MQRPSLVIIVTIKHAESGALLGEIKIENVSASAGDLGDYSVRFGVEKIGAVGVHQRGIMNFPRTKFNVLALLRQALATLEEDELSLTGDYAQRTYKKHSFFGILGRSHL